MRTEGSTATSSLSGRSGSFSHGHNLLDRRPPHAPSPSSCVDAANGDDDCSFATASTRLTLGLDSDSDDGSQLDEQTTCASSKMTPRKKMMMITNPPLTFSDTRQVTQRRNPQVFQCQNSKEAKCSFHHTAAALP